MNCQPVILNEPLLSSESYQGERGWEALRWLSYLTAGRPQEGEVLLIMANTGRLRPKGVEISLVELYERVGCV